MQKKKIILVAERQVITAHIPDEIFNDERWEVATENDVTSAKKQLARKMPDLLITDLSFAGNPDGFQLIKNMREELAADCPVIALVSVADSPGYQYDPHQYGKHFPVDEFVEKPAQAKINAMLLERKIVKLLSV
jgi:DNA-binding NtrC family response regulator